jgi:hypothetical protein
MKHGAFSLGSLSALAQYIGAISRATLRSRLFQSVGSIDRA